MAGVQDQLEIKFRLTDGSDIGPKSFPAATTVVNLKESILAQWPKEKDNGPRTVKDVKLICAGRVLENNKTVAECRSPLCDVPGGVTTMHVVVQPPSQEKGIAKALGGVATVLRYALRSVVQQNAMPPQLGS
ncbi:unnamed protein product [Malus baccata var. baccata]|uniref:Ubiquitin-like domain-containing protein n=1 Tax=Malus domestica TaxID=3750 RepID=A0A498J214_MALDO|nr:hypothetical protein DVH24_031995 [Malus domestica]